MNKTLEPGLTFTVTDVTENQEYEFQVSAENAEGVGAPSDTLGPIKAKDPYGKSKSLTVLGCKSRDN
jgi:titin